jgi:ParB family transcriptional regulator, chromosome partitioning protein
VTSHVVRQRLRLGAVSPKLMQVYRNGELTLEQLMAFAIAEDHVRQETVYERLSYNRDASTIRRLLTEIHVAATDRRAIFVGAEAYTEAGGTILRDLFTEDRGGYFEDVALLDLLVTAKLGRGRCPAGGRRLEMDPSPSRLSARPWFAPDVPPSSGAFGGGSGRP